ncbi:hypothetical protein V6N13_041418 [Hibiscus sabdariffa]|uniref:Uncharacterized protein n=1 Tax=Hibiscus sabdariffa TaxID=183260 RepID=A0ABR2RB83_9ROSI
MDYFTSQRDFVPSAYNSRSISQKLEKILNPTIASEKDICINGNEEPQNSHLWATEPASPVSRGPSRVEVVEKTMVSAHIKQPGDNVVAGQNPIQERIRDDILAMGFVRDEEVRDFEVGDEELYGSEGRGFANISSGQKEKRNPKFEGCNQKGAQNSNFGDFEGESSCFELPEFRNGSRSKKKERKIVLSSPGVCSCNLDYMHASQLQKHGPKEAYVDLENGQMWHLIACCGVARSRKELEVRI